MAHPYVQELTARTEYVTNAARQLAERLDDRGVQAKLGAAVCASMQSMAREVYCPDVVEDGEALLVTLSPEDTHRDAVPTLALRADETALRTARYATFMPRQLQQVDDSRQLHAIAGRMADSGGAPQDIAVQGINGRSIARRFVYRVDGYPQDHEMTLFNLRPLVVLDYREGLRPEAAVRQLSGALRHALFIAENPMVRMANDAKPDDLELRWRTEGQQIAAKVADGFRIR